MSVNLKDILNNQNVAVAFKSLPALKTSIIDNAFPIAKNYPKAVIGIVDIRKHTGAIPVVRRGSNPISINDSNIDASFYAPLPIMPSISITAAELNDLNAVLGDKASRDAWIADQVDTLRRIVRNTTEAIASIVLTTGKYSWSVKTENGTETFEIDFGETLKYSETKITEETKVSDVFDIVDKMAENIQSEGYGETVKFFAGKEVYGKFLNLAEKWASSESSRSPINIQLSGNVINIGGYEIIRMTEKYYNPVTQEMTAKINPKQLVGFASVSDAGIYYCAIDSISNNNKAVPFHIYTEQKGDRAIELMAQSKPVPVRPSKSICVATLID